MGSVTNKSILNRLDLQALNNAREGYRRFLKGTALDLGFRLTPRAEPTAYARCFGLFGLQLLQDKGSFEADTDRWTATICNELGKKRAERAAIGADLAFDKPYLQLLTFSLSALTILGTLHSYPLADHVLPLVRRNIDADLHCIGALRGKARSGNHAMFLAILLLHAREHLGIDDGGRIERWRELHLDAMNQFGFWGPQRSMSHLQFQNGYHQYEIFEFLDAAVPLWQPAADNVASLADVDGHFAPYPGGGACYDYDAVFLITGAGEDAIERHRSLLMRTARSILAEQNADGGFCESRFVRPRTFANLERSWSHVLAAHSAARLERARQALTLLRPRHDRIHTHWSNYSREWAESNLWDSWFRMLTLARIEIAFDPSASSRWGFVDFPGIGYHSCLRYRDKPR